jgi:pimeloyl-ACP methyl ester carboxylesterase
VDCPVYIIGSTGDRVLSASLQEKLSRSFKNPELRIFDGIAHEEYFRSEDVTAYINNVLG